ncbi:CAP domain-containing protein [Saccharothrix yanglingensis]|uniref:Serine protease n=1 Tax=Saccharothrix yanglingensis TaxID=659496 RepID=A0ABU0X7J2_9PSEU|nr:CAP domain-containing protein [Saccharothrix yanglingensis]MDQ2588098.1 serine protease [Saccharothrix yanglingensis]
MREPARKALEDRVVSLVNVERSRRGLAVLGADERLRRSARRHSTDMARCRTLAHRLPGEPDPFERMLAEGFEQPGGENVAFGQETAVRVAEAWMRSAPHRANVLHPGFTRIGVGLWVDATGHWWTQNFGYDGDPVDR